MYDIILCLLLKPLYKNVNVGVNFATTVVKLTFLLVLPSRLSSELVARTRIYTVRCRSWCAAVGSVQCSRLQRSLERAEPYDE